jgi:hypothetical protein
LFFHHGTSKQFTRLLDLPYPLYCALPEDEEHIKTYSKLKKSGKTNVKISPGWEVIAAPR